MSGRSDIVDIEGKVRAQTERAVQFFDGKVTVWLPRSLIEIDETDGTIAMPKWLAMEKGLI